MRYAKLCGADPGIYELTGSNQPSPNSWTLQQNRPKTSQNLTITQSQKLELDAMAAGFAVPTFDPRAAGSAFGDGGFYTGGYAGPAMAPPQPLGGSIETGQAGYFAPQTYGQQGQASLLSGGFEDEPPLLEELGINFEHIYRKTFAVLVPFSKIDSSLHINDDDLAGPLFFGFIFGCFLLLVRFFCSSFFRALLSYVDFGLQSGKVHFGAIYGLSVTGSIALWGLLNLMSDQGISIYTTISVWGYCLLPMVLLAFLSLAMPLVGIFGIILTALGVVWCTHCAAAMFVQASHLVNQRLLIAYPLALFYTCFALFTIF